MPLILGILYLILEVYVSFEVIDAFGVLFFVLEIIITAMLGIFILVNFRLFVGEAIERVRQGGLSYEGFVGSNVFRILGAFLLILPGALTDILGILMQFSIFGFMLLKPFNKGSFAKKDRENQDAIIDVEVIEKDKD